MTQSSRTTWIAIVVALAALGVSAKWVADSAAVPTRRLDEGYVGSEACRACHADNHASWSASYHRRMTQEARPGAVLAPFEGTTPALEAVAWKLSRKGDEYRAEPVAPDGKSLAAPTRVALTTGSHHYQIYWLEVDGSAELAQLPLVWHLGEQRWVPRRSMFLAPTPDSQFAETGRWARTCIKCHTTNPTPRHPADERTHVAEFGISCEACHGPGAAHVALQDERKDLDRDAVRALPADTTVTNPRDLPHDRSSEVCGQCHGVRAMTPEIRSAWEKDGFAFRPGAELAESSIVVRGTPEENEPICRELIGAGSIRLDELFWSDGHVRVSGREYNGLLESPCFQRGDMSCISCHEMHPSTREPAALAKWANDQLRSGMDGPRACLQCHAEYGAPERLRAHTHHALDSSGSDCLNCHMPYTTYGLTKAIRDHTITSPSIAATLATGRPDACNQCHLDRTLAWAADQLHTWYDHPRPTLDADQERTAASVTWALSGDAGQRALMAWNFGWAPARAVSGTGWMPFVLSTLMQDPYDAVRFIATRSARADGRHAGLSLDLTLPIDQQRLAVRSGYLRDWQSRGLSATPAQREAVLVGEDGKLDETRFRALYGRVDGRVMQLAE